MTISDTHLIWIDLEMTGLDTQKDAIIEIATIVTDSQLNILAEGPVLAIHQSEVLLNAMDNWNQRQHKKTGLIERVQNSTVTEAEAQAATIEFLKEYIPANKSPMCGSSICQDRRFLARCMPELEAYFHYRNLDVSTVKEIALRWYPEIAKKFKKQSKHLALDDIKESIEELVFYREEIFNKVAIQVQP